MGSHNSGTQPTTLSDRLRVYSTVVIDPIVTVLARLNISPDLLTIVGMLSHILMAWLIANGDLIWAAVAIFILLPLDSFDGALARKIGRSQGNFGGFLDSTSDRIAEIILFGGYLYFFSEQDQPWMVAASYAAITGSIMVSYARARAESLGVTCSVGLFTRVERFAVIFLTLLLRIPEVGIVILAVGTYFTVGQRAFHVWKQTKDTF